MSEEEIGEDIPLEREYEGSGDNLLESKKARTRHAEVIESFKHVKANQTIYICFIILVLVIVGYFVLVWNGKETSFLSGIVDLLKTVMLLILGYLFGNSKQDS